LKRQNYISLAEAINNWTSDSSVKRKIDEATLLNNWKEFVSPQIAVFTKGLRIDNNILFVKTRSGVVKNELTIIRKPLIKKINEKFNYNLINDIRLE